MACGNVVITSDSGGIREYIEDDNNGYIIDKVNDTDEYINKLDILLKNNSNYILKKQKSYDTVKKFDFDDIVTKYIKYLKEDIEIKKYNMSDEENNIYKRILDNRFRVSDKNNKKIIYKLGKKIPKGIKFKIRKFSEKLYNFTNKY